MLQFFIIKNLH